MSYLRSDREDTILQQAEEVVAAVLNLSVEKVQDKAQVQGDVDEFEVLYVDKLQGVKEKFTTKSKARIDELKNAVSSDINCVIASDALSILELRELNTMFIKAMMKRVEGKEFRRFLEMKDNLRRQYRNITQVILRRLSTVSRSCSLILYSSIDDLFDMLTVDKDSRPWLLSTLSSGITASGNNGVEVRAKK